MQSFGRLGKEGSDLIDQVAARIVGGTDGSSLARKERRLQRTPLPDHLGDYPGRDFAMSASV